MADVAKDIRKIGAIISGSLFREPRDTWKDSQMGLKGREAPLNPLSHSLEWGQLIRQLQWSWFFGHVGLSQGASLSGELLRRIDEGLLPALQEQTDITWLAETLFGKRLKSLLELKDEDVKEIATILFKDKEIPAVIYRQITFAVDSLCQRIAGLALDSVVAKSTRHQPNLLDSFTSLGQARLHIGITGAEEKAIFQSRIKSCEESLRLIQDQSKNKGVSLHLTYRILQIEELLGRLQLLLGLVFKEPGESDAGEILLVIREILKRHLENVKFWSFLKRNTEVLAYQLTAIAEQTGEHYITHTKPELNRMWVRAIKGALIVAILVLIKVLLAYFEYPPLIEGFLFGSVYAVGFCLIHITGGVLATKQPAMTAATLAAAMKGAQNSSEAMGKLSLAVIATLRTQIAALLGNYLFAFPFALLFCFLFSLVGFNFVTPNKADAMIESINPLTSFSLFYAAIAGLCLFLAGIISSLASNWYSQNRISDRLSPFLNSQRDQFYLRYIDQNFGVLMGNVVLGFMLGSMAAVGKVTGLPLDIRHITFASASFGVAWFGGDKPLSWQLFLIVAVGVLLIGFVNLAVSFSLSLFVAMKSKKMSLSLARRVLWNMLKYLRNRPLDLFRVEQDSK